MSQQDAFGGQWTQDKLTRLKNYLDAYVKVFKNQSWATTVYIDAFAGTGNIPTRSTKVEASSQLELLDDEVQSFFAGSAKVALETDPSFSEYLFIERSPKKIHELRMLIDNEFPDKANRIDLVNDDANEYLTKWASSINRKTTRAVVFLDPYGMQVEWRLLEALAATHVVDLWLR